MLFKPNLEFARSLEFDWFCGGHGNIGEKSDFDFYLSYLDEVAALVSEYVPRPASVPDLSLTDYLGGLDSDGRSRLLSELDNHFGLYLYGRQIVAGEERSGGGNPFLSGLIGEWSAERSQGRRRGRAAHHRTAAPEVRPDVQLRRRTAGQRPPAGHGRPAESHQPLKPTEGGSPGVLE